MRNILILFFALLPLAVSAEQFETTNSTGTTSHLCAGGSAKIGQTFTIGTTGPNINFYLQTIKLSYTRSVNEVILMEVFATSGNYPTGSPISTATIPADGILSAYKEFAFSSVVFHPNIKYALVFSSAHEFAIGSSVTDTYSGGSPINYNGSSWSAAPYPTNEDMLILYGVSTLDGGTIGSAQTICYNSDVASFTSSAPATLGMGSYTYTWQYSTTGSIAGQGTWTDIANSNVVAYNPGVISANTYYVRKVYDGYSIAYSNVLLVTVRSQVTGGGIGSGQTICYNTDVAAFTNMAYPTGGMGNYTYSWYSSTTSSTAGDGDWTNLGSSSATYNPGSITATTYYVRRAADVCGSAYSNVLTVNVWPVLTGGVISGNQTICYSTDAGPLSSVSLPTGGVGSYTYTWLYSATSSDPLSGSWTSTGSSNFNYDPGVLTATTYFVRRAVDPVCGTVYSNVLTITVVSQITPGTIAGNQTICYNTDAAGLTSVSGASGGTYTWQYSTTSSTAGSGSWISIPSSNTITYDPGVLTTTTYYTRRAQVGSCTPVYSNVITVTVRTPLSEGSIGSNQTIASGADVAAFTSSAGASGGSGSYTYTWQYSTSSSVGGSGDWTDISSSNSATYDYGTLTTTTNFVRKVVDASCGTRYSNTVTVIVTGSGTTLPCPIAYWALDETTGTALDDAAGSNNATASVNITVGSTTSKLGRSLYFDGNYDYATFASPITLNTGSYSFWMRMTGIADDMVILGSDQFQSRIFVGAGNNFKLETNTNGQEFADYTSYSLNTWYHMVITRAGDVVKFYRNGSLLSTVTISGAADLTVSGIGWSGKSFRGYIDEVGIWNVTLTADEVTQLYNSGSGMTYSCNPPVAQVRPNRSPNKVIYFQSYYNNAVVTNDEEPPVVPEDNFFGDVLYVDPIAGNDANDGFTPETAIKTLTHLASVVDNRYEFIALANATHIGTLPLSSLIRTSGSPMVITTWHKYGAGEATIDGRKTLGTFTQSGNYWKIVDSQLPTGSPDANTNYINASAYLYFVTFMNGIYIDNTFYKISKYPREKRYLKMEAQGAGNAYLDDTDSTRASGFWTGATLCTQGPSWILTKAYVSNYNGSRFTLSGIADEELYGITNNGTDGLKYYLINHRNATKVNGQWYSKPTNDSLVIYYNSNLNAHVVKAPVNDILMNITSCSYVTIQNINFIGSNQEHIRASGNTGLVINNCNFYDAPYAALYATNNTGLTFTNNYINRSGDYGINLIGNANVVIDNNNLKAIGTDETFGGDRNGGHFNGIAVSSGTGTLSINYNHIDSVAYCGIIVSNQTSTANGQVNIRYNFIKNAMMSFSDGAGIYVFRCAGAYNKYIRKNLILNTYDNRAFHRNNGTESRALYIDEGVDIYNDYWICDSNYAYKAPQLSYINSGVNHLTFNDNLLVDATFRGNNSENTQIAYGLRVRQIGANMFNSSVSRNTVVLSDSNSYGMYYTWEAPFNNQGNTINYNKYYNPFRETTDEVWFEYLSGLNARDLTYVRNNTSYEDNSTFNSTGWTFKDVTGITAGQFIWFFYNWSGTAHTFSLGSATFKDLAGTNISGTISLPAYSAKCVMYVSGSLTGIKSTWP